MQPSDQGAPRLSGELKDLPLAEFIDAESDADEVKGGAAPEVAAEIVSPRDPATGQATGKRHYKPVETTVVY
jgi:hypothetical protein